MLILNRILISAIGFLFASSSYARLGETEAQLVERYDKPIMRSNEKAIAQGKVHDVAANLHFKADDWHIVARLVGGKCESISYLKPGEWTDEQFRHVLEANGGRSRWEERKTNTPKTHREWVRRDSTTAVWRMLQGITLETPTYRAAEKAVKNQAKKDASKLPKI